MRQSLIALCSVLFMSSACHNQENAAGSQGLGREAALERGKYLVEIMSCADCHNTGNFSPKPDEGPLQGATVGFEMPGLGVFYPSNLTPDPNAGIGKWSTEDIVKALRTGRTPDGRTLAPIMPWQRYSVLTDTDAEAIAAYLKSLPPSPHKVPPPAQKESTPQPYLSIDRPDRPTAHGYRRR